jgi:hypothetical protein
MRPDINEAVLAMGVDPIIATRAPQPVVEALLYLVGSIVRNGRHYGR